MPIVPIVVPAVASVTGWVFMLSPGPGYLNALLRRLPWWSGDDTGPIDIYTLPWIVILTGLGLTAFVYLFVSSGLRNINGELIEAALVSGSSSTEVFFTVTLPLLRPVLLYGGGVALLLGLGQFTAPLLLGRNAGIDVLTTDMYRSVSQSPIDYSVAAAIGSPLILIGIVVVIVQRFSLGDQRRFVTHGGRAFRVQQRPSKLASAYLVTLRAAVDRAARRGPDRRGAVAVLERDHPVGRARAAELPPDLRGGPHHRGDHDEPDRLARRGGDRPARSASSPPRCCSGGARRGGCARPST